MRFLAVPAAGYTFHECGLNGRSYQAEAEDSRHNHQSSRQKLGLAMATRDPPDLPYAHKNRVGQLMSEGFFRGYSGQSCGCNIKVIINIG